jgi:hypothetical protein
VGDITLEIGSSRVIPSRIGFLVPVSQLNIWPILGQGQPGDVRRSTSGAWSLEARDGEETLLVLAAFLAALAVSSFN